MSLTLIAWFVTFAVLSVRAFTHSATYGLALYLFTFFVNPKTWWWGNDTIGDYRWNLAAAVVYSLAVVVERGQNPKQTRQGPVWPQLLAIALLVNTSIVHFFLAPVLAVSFSRYLLVVKYVALFVVLAANIHDAQALRLALWSMTLGAGYIGYEVTINDEGRFIAGRLLGVGAAGVQEPNELAALLGAVLPLAAGLFFTGSWREKLAIAIVGPMILNVILLCNSRGAFLSLILGVVVFLAATWGPARKRILRGFALGLLALVLLLGDPQIVDRFMTVFANAEEMDNSASYRLVIWGAALQVLREHPLGSGGDGFNRVYSRQYLETGRSVHNGYLAEAVEWGIQGLGLKLLFMMAGAWLVVRTAWRRGAAYNAEAIILASCLITSLAVVLATSFFADFLDNEWGYWIVGFMLGFARAYSSPAEVRPVQSEVRA